MTHMKVFVCNDARDSFELVICGYLSSGQHSTRVEDIQALVFHRSHVAAEHFRTTG